MPGLVVSCVLLSGYLLRMGDRCESMHVNLPTHLLVILDVWTKSYLALPWSALLMVVPFVLFEVAVPKERKNQIRQGMLVILTLIVVSISALTAWSVVDVQDRLLRACTQPQSHNRRARRHTEHTFAFGSGCWWSLTFASRPYDFASQRLLRSEKNIVPIPRHPWGVFFDGVR